ncbi:uncharacterized protein LOC132703736 [Cylas formicarius]|uniref:uncharacterized protein LOC132703736 n=1 Tax=Cylas formicarius TaxID=197179 RepID=UPI002958B408|nr:uncharacterized protein LOC132703736 [Cylas formicarius]
MFALREILRGQTAMDTDEQQTEKRAVEEKGTAFAINKVHVRSGKSFFDGCERWQKCFTSLPIISDKPAKYMPMPYTFRLPPGPKSSRVDTISARNIPFHLWLDHTIAVVWMLFSEQEYDCPLGAAQLQWALAFLKSIFSKNGDRPKDVELCVEKIESKLIDEYAMLCSELSKMNKIEKIRVVPRTTVVKKFAFSKNYADLASKLGAKMAVRVSSTRSIEEELEKLKMAADAEHLEMLDSVSKERAIDILKCWHKEQTSKVKDEIQKLKYIEEKLNEGNQIEWDTEMLRYQDE